MKVLMTTSAAPARSPFFTDEKTPPLGIGFLISELRRAGHEPFFIDNYLKPSDFLENGFLEKERIDAVGIYSNTICFEDTLRMVTRMEKMRRRGVWNGSIMVGGPHVGVAPETLPEYVDHLVIGEGERAIIDILDGKIRERVVKGEAIEDMDDLPRLPFDIFSKLDYSRAFPWFDYQPVFTLNTSRGCPFGCAFCSVGSIWGRKYRAQSAERVIDDIQWLIRDFGARGIYFREDNFTLQKSRLRYFCEGMIAKNIDIQWMCETRVDSLDLETLELMARARCKGIYVGIETASPRLQRELNKNLNFDHVKKIFKQCNNLGINIHASYVVGLPGESPEEEEATLKLSRELQSTTSAINVFVGIPTSPLYEKMVETGDFIYKDSRGLLYRESHNDRVLKYYGDSLHARKAMIQAEEASDAIERALPTDPVYRKSGYFDMLVERYQIGAKLSKNKLVLDSCCGTAWGTYNYIAPIASRVFGVDISEESLEYYGFKHPNLSLQQGDVTNLDFPDHHFDVALALEGIEHFQEIPAIDYLDELFRVLKPGGILMGTTPFMPVSELESYYLEMNPDYLKMYTIDDIEQLLKRWSSSIWAKPVWNATCPYILFLAEKKCDPSGKNLEEAKKNVNDCLQLSKTRRNRLVQKNYLIWARALFYRQNTRLALNMLWEALKADLFNYSWLITLGEFSKSAVLKYASRMKNSIKLRLLSRWTSH